MSISLLNSGSVVVAVDAVNACDVGEYKIIFILISIWVERISVVRTIELFVWKM